MPIKELKCTITVVAGIFPGSPIKEYTRYWTLTADDLKKQHIYSDKLGAAMNYAASLYNPSILNWVKTEWIWY